MVWVGLGAGVLIVCAFTAYIENANTLQAAQKSMELAKEQKNDDYVQMNEKLIGTLN